MALHTEDDEEMNKFNPPFLLLAFFAIFSLIRAAETTNTKVIDFTDGTVELRITGIDNHKFGTRFNGKWYVPNLNSDDNIWTYNYATKALIHKSSSKALHKVTGGRGMGSIALRCPNGKPNQQWVFERDPDDFPGGFKYYIRWHPASDVCLEINDHYIEYGEVNTETLSRDPSKYEGTLVKFTDAANKSINAVFATIIHHNQQQRFKVELVQ